MRVSLCLLAFACSSVGVGCSDTSPTGLATTAVKSLYTLELGDRERERNALRLHATERQQGVLSAIDTSCAQILENNEPNHGLNGSAVADFNRNCLDGLPLSCGAAAGAVLNSVDVGAMQGDRLTAVAHVGPKGGASVNVEVNLQVVNGAWKVDEVRCP